MKPEGMKYKLTDKQGKTQNNTRREGDEGRLSMEPKWLLTQVEIHTVFENVTKQTKGEQLPSGNLCQAQAQKLVRWLEEECGKPEHRGYCTRKRLCPDHWEQLCKEVEL